MGAAPSPKPQAYNAVAGRFGSADIPRPQRKGNFPNPINH